MRISLLIPLIALSACGESTQTASRPNMIAPAPIKLATGLDRVMGKDANMLVSLFGPAAQDVREDRARKLQFAGSNCILDAYLYPPRKGAEPVVTYLAARTTDGRDADKLGCVTALSRR